MATFSPEMINPQAMDSSYLSTQFNMDDLAFQLQDPNALKTDMLSDFMDPFEGIDFRDERALSYSGTSSQSLSPQLPNRQMIPQLPELQGTNALFNAHLEPISPTGSDQSIHSTRKDSIDDDHRAERRRAQNRAAQRAYRQRKDQSLKQREKEIEGLKDELDKAQRLNKTLCKVVALLRERLKEPGEAEEDS